MQAHKWLGIELVEVSLKEKLISAAGAALAIYSVFLITRLTLPREASLAVVASMGATAVLLFAVPHGPLSQPWPVFGGHVISAFIGVCCAQFIPDTAMSTAMAVGLSIGLMHQFKCIHPPGGATAFTAVMGAQSIRDLEFQYVLYPVGINSVVMLLLAIAINYPFPWRRFPAVLIQRTADKAAMSEAVSDADHRSIVEAVRSLDSFVDVSEEDLVYLSRMIADRYANSAKSPREKQKKTAVVH